MRRLPPEPIIKLHSDIVVVNDAVRNFRSFRPYTQHENELVELNDLTYVETMVLDKLDKIGKHKRYDQRTTA